MTLFAQTHSTTLMPSLKLPGSYVASCAFAEDTNRRMAAEVSFMMDVVVSNIG